MSSMSPADMDESLQSMLGTAPDLASLRASKPADEPTRFFLDYLCVRQCIAADFSTERVVRAIATIGITVVELGADWRSESALLWRLFCVIELFATVKAGGRLLVVGPAFEDPKQVQELLQVATSKERSVEVMDSRDEEKTRCRFPDEAKEIRAYIEGSVGYVKLDRQVLSAIGVGCMDRVQAQMEAKKRQDQAADMMYGLAEMLFEAEVNKCVWARACVCVRSLHQSCPRHAADNSLTPTHTHSLSLAPTLALALALSSGVYGGARAGQAGAGAEAAGEARG